LQQFPVGYSSHPSPAQEGRFRRKKLRKEETNKEGKKRRKKEMNVLKEERNE
jgi:hypothetical protein